MLPVSLTIASAIIFLINLMKTKNISQTSQFIKFLSKKSDSRQPVYPIDFYAANVTIYDTKMPVVF